MKKNLLYLTLAWMGGLSYLSAAPVTQPTNGLWSINGQTVTTPNASGLINPASFSDSAISYNITIAATGGPLTLENTGSIITTGDGSSISIGSGVSLSSNAVNTITLDGSGSVTNAGTITGMNFDGVYSENEITSLTNTSTGQITGGVYGIEALGSIGSLNNSGIITGTSEYGIYSANGITSVTNNSTGQITGGVFGIDAAGGSIGSLTNAGTITGTDEFGVYAQIGINSVTNNSTGQITGGVYGIDAANGSIGSLTNAGTITGTSEYGIYSANGINSVTNSSTGQITGGVYGIDAANGSIGSLTNAGTITGTDQSGVYALNEITSLTNSSTGQIMGGVFGIDAAGGSIGSLTNAGTITGTDEFGVYAQIGINSVTNNSTGQITGGVYGIDAANGSIGSLTNAGTITGTDQSGVYALNEITSLTNSSTGQIMGGVYGVQAGNSINSLTNSGIITGTMGGITSQNEITSLTNNSTGQITGGIYGIKANGSIGSLTNNGTITGGIYGIYSSGPIASLTNAGTITGTSIYGVYSGNEITSLANASTGHITGGVFGIDANGSIGSLTNVGTITGTSLDGVYAANRITSLDNTGQITGGTNGIDVAGVFGSIGNLINTGSITGTTGWGIYSSTTSTIILDGGMVFGGTDAIHVNDGAGDPSTITVNGRASVHGDMVSGFTTGTLNLNLVGGTPAEVETLRGDIGNTSGTVTFAGNTYTWNNFTLQGNAISLEQAVDPGLLDLATKIDNNPLPAYTGPGSVGAQFDLFYTAAATNPEAALQELSGRTITQGFQDLAVNANQSLLSLWGSQLENGFGSTGGFDLTGFSISSQNMVAYNDTSTQLGQLVRLASTDAGPMLLPETNNNRWGGWLSGNITVADSSGGRNGQPGYNAVNGSPTLGFDYLLTPEWKVGVLGSFTVNDAEFNDGSKIDGTSELLGLYSTWAHGPWRVHGLAAGGISQYQNQRNAFGQNATSNPDGYDALGEGTVGYEIPLGGGYTVTPEAGLQYTHLTEDGYTENGASALDLSVASQDIDSLRTHLGAKLDKSFDITHELKFAPEISAAWYHETLDNARSVSSSLSGAPAVGSFVTQTSDPQRDYALVSVGLNTAFTGYGAPVGMFVNYTVQAGQSDYIEHNITGGIRVAF